MAEIVHASNRRGITVCGDTTPGRAQTNTEKYPENRTQVTCIECKAKGQAMTYTPKPVIEFPEGMNARNPKPAQGDAIMRQIEEKIGDTWMQVKLGRNFMIYRKDENGRQLVAQSSSFINAVSQATQLAITQIVPTKK